jgi:hypothetical protein
MTLEEIQRLNVGFLNLRVNYSVVLVKDNKLCRRTFRNNNACFSSSWSYIRNSGSPKEYDKVRIRISACTDAQINIAHSQDNLVYLKEAQVIEWLDHLCEIFSKYSLTYKIIPATIYTGYEYHTGDALKGIHVVVKAQNIPGFYVKWIMSYVRLIYEGSTSLVLRETFTLRNLIPELKYLPLLSAFMFVNTTGIDTHAFTAMIARGFRHPETRIYTPRTLESIQKVVNARNFPYPGVYIDKWHEEVFFPRKVPYESTEGLSFKQIADKIWHTVSHPDAPATNKPVPFRFDEPTYVREYVFQDKIPEPIVDLYKAMYKEIRPYIN